MRSRDGHRARPRVFGCRPASLVLALGLASLASCVVPPPPGTPPAPAVEILATDPAGLGWGATAAAALDSPALADRTRALFGPAWTGGEAVEGRRLSAPAPAFFGRATATRVVRIGAAEYLAAAGCAAQACAARRGLLLVRRDRDLLLARLDDGGFSHYYAFGPGAAVTPEVRALVDAAWRALERRSG